MDLKSKRVFCISKTVETEVEVELSMSEILDELSIDEMLEMFRTVLPDIRKGDCNNANLIAIFAHLCDLYETKYEERQNVERDIAIKSLVKKYHPYGL